MDGPIGLARAMMRGVGVVFDAILWAFIRFGRGVLIFFGAVAACVAVAVLCATWQVLRQLPDDPRDLWDGRARGSVAVLDRNGDLLGVRGERFYPLEMKDVGGNLRDAVLSTEDRRFFWHLGVDPIGLARALLVNWRAGRTEQGGSSITQQVAKLAFLSNERRLSRKLQEAPLALALEWKFTKQEIFEIYVNRAYLGGGAFGFRAAALFYFGREPAELSRGQSALLAGLLRAPSKWSPLSDFSSAQDRARIVADAMLDAGAVDAQGHAEALAQIDQLQAPQIYETASHFVDWVDSQVPDRIWRHGRNLELSTTLDPITQAYAERGIDTVFESDLVKRRDKDADAAMVVLDTSGEVRAMVGGRDYVGSQYNRAAQSRRQLGSAFKPIVYAAALGAGVHPRSRVRDEPVRIGSWRPANYSHRYRGPISLTKALAKSSNVASVRLSQRAGVKNVVETARRLGFAGPIPAYPSIALGVIETNPLEVASAYASIARGGKVTPAFAITEIRERETGEALWRRREPPARQAIRASDAGHLVSMLRAVVETGTGRRAQLEGRPVAGKTGTTQDYRDAWFAGFSGDYVGVVWMGKDDFSKTQKVTGGRVPAQIWREAMEPLHRQAAVTPLKEAEGRSWRPSTRGQRSYSRSQRREVERRQARRRLRDDGYRDRRDRLRQRLRDLGLTR